MCITPAGSFAQTAGTASPSIPVLTDPSDFCILGLPSFLPGFHCSSTKMSPRDETGRLEYIFEGGLPRHGAVRICQKCGSHMVVKSKKKPRIRHIPVGGWSTFIDVEIVQMECKSCGKTHIQEIPFKAQHYMMTKELYQLVVDMLSTHTCTLKDISEYTGINKNTVRKIDFDRLQEKYTSDGTALKPPAGFCRYLSIDEFLLHRGHQYATHIINLETGKILYVARGKKKEVVYDFIDLVGQEWMKNIEVVACDMNSDFQEAFQEKCPHIKIVFDHFHIVQNLNKRINDIRKDEIKRLIDDGKKEEAESLKGTKFILLSSREKLLRKSGCGPIHIDGTCTKNNKESEKNKKESPFKIYETLIQQNRLLMTCDFVKEALKRAFSTLIREEMVEELNWIVELCEESEDRHLKRFAKLIKNHMDGIVTHAEFNLTSGKIEGVNNKIKTIRRMAYGIPDDRYFFLKLLDMNAGTSVRHPLFRLKGGMKFRVDAEAA